MGNQSHQLLNSAGVWSREDRASLQLLTGTWFVDDYKIVITADSTAAVYSRGNAESWVYEESLMMEDNPLYFRFKDHILSKGRIRGQSNELIFRNGEDVRLWTREDPFTSDLEMGGDVLSLKHPSEMGANRPPSDSVLDIGFIPMDSSELLPEPFALADGADNVIAPNMDLGLETLDSSTFDDPSSPTSSVLSMVSDIPSSEFLAEPSWVDANFFDTAI